MKIGIKLAYLAASAALLLSGCASDNTVSIDKYNELNGKYDELNGQYNELKTQYEELNKQYSELEEKNETSEKENAALQKKNADIEAKLADSNSIVYNGGGYMLRYLGDECDAEGRVVLVLSLVGAYIPYIRVDTKATELFSGIMVLDGTYEFANENIDENGYLYLISPIVEEDKLPFRTEKYIKLRFIDSETGQYTMFDKTLYNDSYTHYVGFNGNIVISTVVADENGNARYYDEGTVLNVQGGSALVLFDGEKTE